MLILDEHRIAFAFPAKTGSTTAVKFISNFRGATKVLPQKHLLPSEVVKDYPQIKDYRIFCFVRNPVDRFVSAMCMNGTEPLLKDLANAICKSDDLDIDEFLRKYFLNGFLGNARHESFRRYMFLSQAKYFQGFDVTALDFDDYENELRKATKDLELDKVEVTRENEGNLDMKQSLASKVKSFVRAEYAEDYRLWEEKFGRRIDA